MDKPKEFGTYDQAIRMAWNEIENMNLSDLASRTQARWDPERKTAALPYLDRGIIINLGEKTVRYDSGERASSCIACLALHHLILARDIPLSGKWAPYRELPNGHVFAKPFQERSIDPLARAFGDDPQVFKTAAGSLNGTPSDVAANAFAMPFFPRIPVLVILWPGDDELPHAANIMFDSRITLQTDIEDVAEIGETLACELVHRAGKTNVPGLGMICEYD